MTKNASNGSRRAFLIILLFFTLLLLVVDAVFYYGMDVLLSLIAVGMKGIPQNVYEFEKMLRLYFVPASAGVFVLFAILLWVSLKSTFRRDMPAKGKSAPKNIDAEAAKPDPREKERYDTRMFLHLLSVLQREGRLVDFFSEDLSLYEDAQIGAAVRTIHDTCNKTLKKYMALKAVIEEDEGEEVELQADFNPNAVKLTGNVVGDPPFKGILRHRGWQAGKLQVPILSDTDVPNIVAPAEVEIQ